MPIDIQLAEAVERIKLAIFYAMPSTVTGMDARFILTKAEAAITAELTAAYEKGRQNVLNHLGTNKT